MAWRIKPVFPIQRLFPIFTQSHLLPLISANQFHQQPQFKFDDQVSNEEKIVSSLNKFTKSKEANPFLKSNAELNSLNKQDYKLLINTRYHDLMKKQSDMSLFVIDKPGSNQPDKEQKLDYLYKCKYHIEEFLPKFFDYNSLIKYLAPSMFVTNVIFENDTRGSVKTSVGFSKLNLRLNAYKLYYKVTYYLKKIIVLRIDLDDDTNSIDTTFRIARHRSGRLPGKTNKVKASNNEEWDEITKEFIQKHAEWLDYRMIIHLNNKGRIWKIVLTQLTRRETPARQSLRITDRILVALGRYKRTPVATCQSDKTANSLCKQP